MRILILLAAFTLSAAQAATCTTTSGSSRNRLLELYTSEGCSSCPPADRWLSQLPQDQGIVPLAFHVDYWDRLGWKDPFAQAAFSARQRDRNRSQGWVYTPQFMLDGHDFRSWVRERPATQPARADVTLSLSLTHTRKHIDVQAVSQFLTGKSQNGATLYLALYENNLRSAITAGENAQRTLHHDYVVRQLIGPLVPAGAHHTFNLRADWKLADLGVAAWVQNAQGETLQALAHSCSKS